MKCPTCLSVMKSDTLFTSIQYSCQSLYCNLNEQNGWYFWKEFKQKYSYIDKPIFVEYINRTSSSGKLKINNFNHFEYDENLKFRIMEED